MTVYELLQIYFELLSIIGTSTIDIYTLSLHDALPIYSRPLKYRRSDPRLSSNPAHNFRRVHSRRERSGRSKTKLKIDRKSTRLNSSHVSISYAVFCLKKKIYTLQSD